ncbi:hypothetical protein GCM10010274_44230 [Streptomyces lavendofoliae]|uniref:Uncharacterized protein n=1 Tax=Streptomyces lavendofoliae TaxID=67314 RepID=A0A918I211_9ACTN|nr:hypothetical protein GCM10010274_44230 [Streptomyces lavendofoliae]
MTRSSDPVAPQRGDYRATLYRLPPRVKVRALPSARGPTEQVYDRSHAKDPTGAMAGGVP